MALGKEIQINTFQFNSAKTFLAKNAPAGI